MADGRLDVDFGPTQSGAAVVVIEQDTGNNLMVFHAAAQTVTLATLVAQHQQHQSLPAAGGQAQSGGALVLIEQDTGNNLTAFQAASQTVRLFDGVVVVSARPSGGVTPPIIETTAVRPQKATVLSG